MKKPIWLSEALNLPRLTLSPMNRGLLGALAASLLGPRDRLGDLRKGRVRNVPPLRHPPDFPPAVHTSRAS